METRGMFTSFSLYSDASISLTGTVRTAWVIKLTSNHNLPSHTVSKGSEIAPHRLPSGHSTAAELYGIFIALTKYRAFIISRQEYRFANIPCTVYSDSQSAIIGLAQPSTRCKDYLQVYAAIEQLASNLHVSFVWVKRASNREADILTTQKGQGSRARREQRDICSARSQIVRHSSINPNNLRKLNQEFRDRLLARQGKR